MNFVLTSGVAPLQLSVRARRVDAARCLLLAMLLTLVLPATASVEPHELVGEVIGRVLQRLDTNTPPDSTAQGQLLQLFEQELSPHFAFAMITRWVAGAHWQVFSDSEQAELTAAVSDYIVHVYASLLARGREVAIHVDPHSTVRTRSARVNAVMETPDGRDFALEFRLLRSDEDWKLYDLAVDGLSFARSLRAELSPVIDAGGISALREYLERHR